MCTSEIEVDMQWTIYKAGNMVIPCCMAREMATVWSGHSACTSVCVCVGGGGGGGGGAHWRENL